MTPIAITFLLISVLLIWGGLVVSIVVLRRDGRLVEELEARERESAADRGAGAPRAGDV